MSSLHKCQYAICIFFVIFHGFPNILKKTQKADRFIEMRILVSYDGEMNFTLQNSKQPGLQSRL